jgi:transposase
VRCAFRARFVAGPAASPLLDAWLDRGRDRQQLQAHGRQRTDATHVLGAIRTITRVVGVAATLRHALHSLALVAPGWLQAPCRPEWLERSGPRVHNDRVPKAAQARHAYAQTVGMDGIAMLEALDAEEAPRWWREVPAVETLRRIGVQPCYGSPEGGRWRTATEGLPPAAKMLSSPSDLDAHYAKQ